MAALLKTLLMCHCHSLRKLYPYHVGDHHFEKEFGRASEQNRGLVGCEVKSSSRGSVGDKPAGPFFISRPLNKYTKRLSNFSLDAGSNSLTNGSPLPTTCNFYYQHDFIALFQNSLEGIFAFCAPLYLQGRSLKEISALTGFPYSTIRTQLVKGGVTLRPNKSVSSTEVLRQRFKNSSPPPYGYCYLDGCLQKDPREYPILQIIEQQRQQNKNPTSIAKYLNGKKLKPRKGKVWKQPTVYYIVQRLNQPTNNGSQHTEERT